MRSVIIFPVLQDDGSGANSLQDSCNGHGREPMLPSFQQSHGQSSGKLAPQVTSLCLWLCLLTSIAVLAGFSARLAHAHCKPKPIPPGHAYHPTRSVHEPLHDPPFIYIINPYYTCIHPNENLPFSATAIHLFQFSNKTGVLSTNCIYFATLQAVLEENEDEDEDYEAKGPSRLSIGDP